MNYTTALSKTDSKQNQTIYQISSELTKNLPELLEKLDINYRESKDSYVFTCPVHGGDNPSGCSINNKGYWKCWTHHCEEEFKSTIFGFVRGVLSYNNGKRATMEECLRWCMGFLNIESIALEDEKEKIGYFKDIKLLEIFQSEISRDNNKTLTRDQVRAKLNIPSQWYLNDTKIDRNFTPEILDKFDVGDCLTPETAMYQRAVVPVYDENNIYVGCLGRTLVDSPNKWKNEKNFHKENYLYGLNFASQAILETGVVIIVEGQSCIWRLHQAGFINCVGIFGAELSNNQLLLLEKSGAMTLIILTDNDEAGNKAANKIINKCGRRFNYIRPELPKKDISELTVDLTKEFLGELYAKYNCPMWKKG